MTTFETAWEYAMLRTPDGAAVPRTAAKQSLQKAKEALARAGGRPPSGPDGEPMLWSEQRGWFPRDERAPRRAGRPLSELIARQRFREHVIRQDHLDREIRVDHALLRGASPLAWCYARQFRHRLDPQPSFDAPADMLTGWRLALRGFDSPPAWLLQERADTGGGR